MVVDSINPYSKYLSSSGPSCQPLPPALIEEMSEGLLRNLSSSDHETFSRMSLSGNVSGTYLINTARAIHRANCRYLGSYLTGGAKIRGTCRKVFEKN